MIDKTLNDIALAEAEAAGLVAAARTRSQQIIREARQQAEDDFHRQKSAAQAAGQKLIAEATAQAEAWRAAQQGDLDRQLRTLAEAARPRLEPAARYILDQVKKRYGLAAD